LAGIAATLGAGALAACGATPTAVPTPKSAAPAAPTAAPAVPAKKVKLRVGTWWDIWKDPITWFQEKNPTIEIAYEVTPGGGDYVNKMLTQIAAGDYPDIFMVPASWFQELAAKNLFTPIDDLVARDKIDMSKWLLDPYVWGGLNKKLYGFLRGAAIPMGLYYNKKLFDAASVKYPTKAWTWKELRETAKTLTKGDQWGLIGPGSYPPLWHKALVSNGGSLFNADETKCLLNDPACVEAFQFFVDMVQVDKCAPSPSVIKEGDRTGFLAGKAAMQHYQAQWYSYKEMSVNFTVPVWHILYPGAGKVDVHFAESHPWCIATSSKQKEEAWAWMKFITMDKQPLMYLTNNYVPGAYDFPGLMAGVSQEIRDHYQPIVDAQASIRPNRFGVKAAAKVQQIVNEQVDLMYENKKSVKQGLADAVAQIDPLLR
jgi:multiple sugar transport system substrate-binding protein